MFLITSNKNLQKGDKLIRPTNDRIIVERLKKENISPGGIHLIAKYQHFKHEGKVIATGNGKKKNGVIIPMDVKVGDVIMFNKNAGVELKVDGESVLIMEESEVVGVIE